MSTPIESAFNEHAATLRRLGAALEGAAAIRYEPSPGMVRSGGSVPNPVLDTVLDSRRAAVSAAVTRTQVALWNMTASATEALEALTAAVARWEGEATTTEG